MIPPSLRFLPVLLLTIAVLFAPEADAQNADQLKIDENWVTMIQQEDQSAFMTHEYIFLNNSANSIYNGSIAVWIQDDSNILAECCGGASNMACRYREDGYMSCFNFQSSGQNTYTGNPFYGDNKLSYYGRDRDIDRDVECKRIAEQRPHFKRDHWPIVQAQGR